MGHGEAVLLFEGETVASMKLRDLLLTCDTDLGEVTCVVWSGMDRTVLLRASLRESENRARIQALFDARFSRQPPPMEV